MEIGQINNSQIIQNQQLDSSGLNLVSKTKKNIIEKNDSLDALSLNLSPNATKSQRSSFLQDIEQVNEALAISQIAINGLEKQSSVLTNIKKALTQTSTDNATEVKTVDIKQFLQQFSNIGADTKYNNQSLLSQDNEDTQITINLNENSLDVTKPDTTKITSELDKLLNKPLLSKDEVNNLMNTVDSGLQKLQDFLKNFSQIKDKSIDVAKDITAKQQNDNANFGKESSDFSKTNLTSQMGYLLASQANANQASNIKLLAAV